MWHRVFFSSLVILLSACTQEHEVSQEDILSVEVVFFGGSEATSIVELAESSATVEKLYAWLDQNRGGWKPYYATAPVGDFVVRGEGLSLGVSEDAAILHYVNLDGDVEQLIKKIDRASLRFLDELDDT